MRSDILKVLLGAVLIIAVIVAYTFEVAHFQNTLDFKKLLLVGLVTGAIIGLTIGFLLARGRSILLEKFQLVMGVFVLSLLLAPLLVSSSNRWFSPAPKTEHLELLRVETYAGSRFGTLEALQENPDGYRIFLLRDSGEVIRLQSKEIPFPGKEKGDQVEVPISRGLWGIEFVNW